MRAALGAALFAGVAWATLTLALTHAGDAAFSRRMGAGCEELEPCQTLEREAERRVDECSFACGRAAAEYRAARLMRFRAEERRAVRDHYLERDRAEQLERQTQRTRRLDEWQRREAARAGEAERDRRYQLELEQLRQAQVERRLAQERERRQSYYSALGPEGRALRLERCLAASERCDALVLDLLDATRDDAERRKLAERNEGVTRPAPKAAPSATTHEARQRRGRDEALPTAPSSARPEPDAATATPSS
jgi:signal transduction histidine kinase